jgi:hypothetical protein
MMRFISGSGRTDHARQHYGTVVTTPLKSVTRVTRPQKMRIYFPISGTDKMSKLPLSKRDLCNNPVRGLVRLVTMRTAKVR